MTLCTLRAATVLSRDCRADFGRPLTKKVMSHLHDGPGVTAPSRTNIVPLTRVWNPPPSVTPPLKNARKYRANFRFFSGIFWAKLFEISGQSWIQFSGPCKRFSGIRRAVTLRKERRNKRTRSDEKEEPQGKEGQELPRKSPYSASDFEYRPPKKSHIGPTEWPCCFWYLRCSTKALNGAKPVPFCRMKRTEQVKKGQVLDGPNRQSPIASVQRTWPTLAVPRGTNTTPMNANRAIRIAAKRTQGL